jgi:predicted metal-dependent phosphoesterase TrpH
MKLDLHVHAAERSACAKEGEESQIRAAIAAGLDGIAFTDHHTLVPRARMRELRRKYAPFKIFTGIEITAEGEDWLVIGLDNPELESTRWRYVDLRRFVREHDGFIALAHPFRYVPRINVDIAANPPDGIEVRSMNTPADHEQEIRAIATRLGLRLLENSDAHWNAPLGRFYNVLPDIPAGHNPAGHDDPGDLYGDRELTRILKAG